MDKRFTEEALSEQIISTFGKRPALPLVPSITNYVTAEFVVNCQLALGASCAVLNLPEEACEMAERCDAFYINLGTILPVYAETVPAVIRKLYSRGTPWVLDPVAAGLGGLRRELLREIAKYPPTVIKANPAEIIALAALWGVAPADENFVPQVDSAYSVAQATKRAQALAAATGAVVVVTGDQDFVTDGCYLAISLGGSPQMKIVTGFGCALGGVTALFCSFCEPFAAALAAVNAFNAAGKIAYKRKAGPAGFKTRFIDALYGLTPEEIAHNRFMTA